MAKAGTLSRLVAHHGPTALFAVLTIVGIVFIWTAKLWGINTLVVTSVPIGIMFVYLMVSIVANGMRLHNEQAGDNLYYMGFLFTLSSLGVSLYRFAGDASIDEIVSNFGVAVTSTICGIAFRILFNQMRRDPVDIERSVRHELAEMTRRVRSELDSSAREFSSYRRTSSQMLVEGFEEIGEQAEKTGQAIQSAIETLSREAIKPIQEASEKLTLVSQRNLALFEERSARINVTADEATERLNSAAMKIAEIVENLGKAVETMSGTMKAMSPPDEVLRIELKPAIAALQDVSALQKKAQEEDAARVERQHAQNSELVQVLAELPKILTTALEPLKALVGTGGGLPSATNIFGAAFDDQLSRKDGLSTSFTGSGSSDDRTVGTGPKPAELEGAQDERQRNKGWFSRW